MSLVTPFTVILPVASALVALPSVFTFLSELSSNVISGNFSTFIQFSPCRCSFIVALPTCSDFEATTILPLVEPGCSGSNVTVPLIPLAVPLMDSKGASVLKTTLFTPFGSLKSNWIGAANTGRAVARVDRLTANFDIGSICFWFDKKGCDHKNHSQ